jgi:uncharacterized protein
MDLATYAIRDNRAEWGGRTLADWTVELTSAIVATFDPRRIVLFGSVADGTDGPDSDIDLLVVFDHAPLENRRQLMVDLRRATRHIGAPHDLLVTALADFERNRDIPGSTEFEPAQHGTVVYERPTA